MKFNNNKKAQLKNVKWAKDLKDISLKKYTNG